MTLKFQSDLNESFTTRNPRASLSGFEKINSKSSEFVKCNNAPLTLNTTPNPESNQSGIYSTPINHNLQSFSKNPEAKKTPEKPHSNKSTPELLLRK